MKRALALACLAGTSCILDSNESGSGAHLMVTWQLASLATNTTAPCPAGFDTAAVYSQPVDDTGANAGDPTIDLFDCSSGYGLTSPIDIDEIQTYVETVSIATDDNSSVYGQTVPMLVTIGDTVQEVDTLPIYVDGGHFEITWQLVGAAGSGSGSDEGSGSGSDDGSGSGSGSGSDEGSGSGSGSDILSCAEIPTAQSIGLTAMGSDGHTYVAQPLLCDAQPGYTDGIPDGTYTVTLSLLDGNGSALGTSQPIASTIATSPTIGNPIVQLPQLAIDVSAP